MKQTKLIKDIDLIQHIESEEVIKFIEQLFKSENRNLN